MDLKRSRRSRGTAEIDCLGKLRESEEDGTHQGNETSGKAVSNMRVRLPDTETIYPSVLEVSNAFKTITGFILWAMDPVSGNRRVIVLKDTVAWGCLSDKILDQLLTKGYYDFSHWEVEDVRG